MYKIMIVEDDRSLGQLLQGQLEKYNYTVHLCDDFGAVLEQFTAFEPHLLLLDINLPKYDGYYWCREVRKQSKVPIIFISARESAMDQVMALQYGGDDYMTKPFMYEVALAKIESHLRRNYGQYATADERTVAVAGLVYYPERLKATFKEADVQLSKTEGILLEALMQRSPKSLTREDLLEKIWDDTTFVGDNTLNVNVTRLRKRLAEIGIHDAIVTVRSVGYQFVQTWEE